MNNKEMYSNKKPQPHKLFFIWMIVILVFANTTYSQNITDTVANKTIQKALNSGNIQELALLFNKKVDITLPNQTGIYSNTQAYFVLKDFFENNHPTGFHIITENYNNGSNLIVGNMHTAKTNFRVSYLTKYSDDKLYIYQIRIEN